MSPLQTVLQKYVGVLTVNKYMFLLNVLYIRFVISSLRLNICWMVDIMSTFMHGTVIR